MSDAGSPIFEPSPVKTPAFSLPAYVLIVFGVSWPFLICSAVLG